MSDVPEEINISLLLDFYGAMLTEKQRSCIEMSYEDDMSLAEIADEMDISRQAVHDNIKRGREELFELEEKLHMAERFKKAAEAVREAKEFAKHCIDENNCGPENMKLLEEKLAGLQNLL